MKQNHTCYFPPDTRLYERRKKNITDARDTVFCLVKTVDENGTPLKCDYEQRIDRHNKAVADGKLHTCHMVPDLNNGQRDIRDYSQAATDGPLFKSVTGSSLLDELCIVVGRLNLSLEAGCSDTMYNFIMKCVEYGMSLKSSKDPMGLFQSQFPQPNRDAFRRRFIQLAIEINKRRMQQFNKEKCVYASLSLDEGSTLKTQYLDYVLHNTKYKLGEYVADTRVMEGGKAKDYKETIPKGLHFISSFFVNISTIVVDGNTAQLKALRELKNSSSSSEMIRKIIIVPCLCHRINNAYKFAVKHTDKLNKMVNNMRNIAKALNSSKSEYNKCPTFVDTRWIYDLDILLYLKKNVIAINTFLQSNDIEYQITDEMLDLEVLLMVLKRLTVIFEDPNLPLSRAYPILESAIDVLTDAEENAMKSNKPIYRGVRNSLKSYTISSKEGGIWLLSYLLTPKGHKDIKERKAGKQRRKGVLREFRYFTFTPGSTSDSDDSQHDFVREKTYEEFYQKESDEVEEIVTVTEKEVNSYFERACSTMQNICDTLQMTKDEKDHIMRIFDAYLAEEMPDDFPQFRENLQGDSWNWKIVAEDDRVKPFADIAMRLEPTPCSEASAERAISLQRLVILKQRNKALKELIDARLVYMRCQAKKFLNPD